MFGIRSVLYFIAGLAFWEAVSHIHLQLLGLIPLRMWGMTITPQANMIIVLSAFALSAFLIAVARQMSCDCMDE